MWTNHISVFDLGCFCLFLRFVGDKGKKNCTRMQLKRKKNLCVLISVVRRWRKLGTNEMAFFLQCYYHAILSRTKNEIVSHVTKHSNYISCFFLSSIRCRRRSSTNSSSNGSNTMHPFFLLAAPISHSFFCWIFLLTSFVCHLKFIRIRRSEWCICGNKLMIKKAKNFVFVAPKNLLIYNFRIYISTSPASRFPKPEKYVCKGDCVSEYGSRASVLVQCWRNARKLGRNGWCAMISMLMHYTVSFFHSFSAILLPAHLRFLRLQNRMRATWTENGIVTALFRSNGFSHAISDNNTQNLQRPTTNIHICNNNKRQLIRLP